MNKSTFYLKHLMSVKFSILVTFCTLTISCTAQKNNPAVGIGESAASISSAIPLQTSDFAKRNGVGSGGGGDVVVCYDKNGQIKDMESYDLWIARFNYKFLFDRKEIGMNLKGKVSYEQRTASTIERLKKIDPLFAKKLESKIAVFSAYEISAGDYIKMVPSLTRNGDSGAVIIPTSNEHCHAMTHERMFWQVDNPTSNQYSYQLVERLWNAAPESVKSAVTLHEIIWKVERETFLGYGLKNSTNTQYYNAFIHSNELLQYKPQQYVDFLKGMKGYSLRTDQEYQALRNLSQKELNWYNHSLVTHKKLFSVYSMGIAYEVDLNLRLDSDEYGGSLAWPQYFKILGQETLLKGGLEVVNGKVRIARLVKDTVFRVGNKDIAFEGFPEYIELNVQENGPYYISRGPRAYGNEYELYEKSKVYAPVKRVYKTSLNVDGSQKYIDLPSDFELREYLGAVAKLFEMSDYLHTDGVYPVQFKGVTFPITCLASNSSASCINLNGESGPRSFHINTCVMPSGEDSFSFVWNGEPYSVPKDGIYNVRFNYFGDGKIDFSLVRREVNKHRCNLDNYQLPMKNSLLSQTDFDKIKLKTKLSDQEIYGLLETIKLKGYK